MTVVSDAPKGKRDGRLGETCRRHVLPRTVPPRRPAVRRLAPTRPSYFRVLDSTGFMSGQIRSGQVKSGQVVSSGLSCLPSYFI